ncbi:hypothetical protein OHA98_07950 [Streptomyces sp. NBC_00654]|uniref:hypothetical protein n=1 Tax=Streptomyces sp. NBC_00654 TaxID=2975799 RepID=UPI002256A66A|nr:hypothetical protein [Streptomyces sp. NBC_00654]MCX4964758.1 hypothetical protein [Streptomyces sp. NBC_00654]
MDPLELNAAATPTQLGGYLSDLPQPPTVHHHGPARNVRTDLYQGHRIVVTTTYEITVDGMPVPAHVGVDNNGRVHCHALPAYHFLSAVDTVRTLIDNYPDEYPAPPDSPGNRPPAGDGGHHHGGG